MLSIENVVKQYRAGKSPYQISEEYRKVGVVCYPNKVRRLLQKVGEPIRDKSDAQSLALSTNRVQHPTKGKHHSNITKEKIGEKISEGWKNLDDAGKAYRSGISKKRWDAMSEGERSILRQKSAEAIRRSADVGSKIERFLLYALRKDGFAVEFHRKMLYPQKFQVDLFLPGLPTPTAIEVDGLSHSEAIWGDEAFERTKHADAEKNGLLLSMGCCVIRLQAIAQNVSAVYQRKLLDKLLPVVYNIRDRTGQIPIEERLIYVFDE